MPWVEPELCEGCESCVDECPSDAIEMKEDVAWIDPGKCVNEGLCLDSCPTEAIKPGEKPA